MAKLKKVLAVMLCAFMLAGLLPAGVSSAENSGCSITDVELSGKTATAHLTNDGACRLVVAIYDPESGRMLASGITDVAANAGKAQAELDIAAMPRYFIIRAFALVGDMSALCAKYESPLYTKAFENYRKVTVTVFTDENGVTAAVPGARISAESGLCDGDGDGEWDDRTAQADENGRAVICFEPGKHTVTAAADGYFQGMADITVSENGGAAEIRLVKKDTSEPGTQDEPSDGTGSDDGWIDRRHFYFGSYPQTYVTAEMGEILDAEATGWKSYGYYSGSGTSSYGDMTPGDYMLYCDVTRGSEKYRGVTFTAYRPYTIKNAFSTDPELSFQRNNGYIYGNTYWFRYEPLEWRLINSQSGLAISENIIDSRSYADFISRSGSAYINESGAESNDWDTSSLRSWLNGGFYSTAFTAEQQSKITEGGPSGEKIYLLSENEATNPVYFTGAFPRPAEGTGYAKCQGLEVNADGKSNWRLLTPGISSFYTEAVFHDGNIDETCSSAVTCTGVRPAMKIDLSALGERSSSIAQPASGAQQLGAGIMAGTGVFDYSCADCLPGNDYILLNVTGYGSGFSLTTANLEYIDQIKADAGGSVSGKFTPRNNVPGSKTLLIGRFAEGFSAKELTVTEETAVVPGSDIPDINIRNYKSPLTVDYKSKLIFHTDIEAPDGYWIIWSTGDMGSSLTIDSAVKGEYSIKADLVRQSDRAVVKSTQVETVKVNTGIFARIIAFFREIFGILPVYEDNNRR